MKEELTILTTGTKVWRLNGKYHREDGPSIEYSFGGKVWHRHGKLHREDGPAIEFSDGHEEWYLNGKQIPCYNQEDFLRLMKLKAFW